MTKLRACRACGQMVSRGAKACPQCGQSKPGRGFTERHPLMAWGFIGLVVYIVAINVSPTATEPAGNEVVVQPPSTNNYPPVLSAWLTGWSGRQTASVQETCRSEPGCDPNEYTPEARPETTFGWNGPQQVEKIEDWASGPRYRVVANGRTVLMYLEGGAVVGVYLMTADGGRRNLCRDDAC